MPAKNPDPKVFVLIHAKSAAETALLRGVINETEMAHIAALASLGIDPPKTSRDRDPLALHGCDAEPGSWAQYVEACFRAYRGKWDLHALERDADSDLAARKRKNFMTHVLNATIRGASAPLLRSGALPYVRPHLTADRLCGIFHDAIDKNEDRGQDPIEAVSNAARWVVRSVLLTDYCEGRITRDELATLTNEVWLVIRDEELPGNAGRDIFNELRTERITDPVPRRHCAAPSKNHVVRDLQESQTVHATGAMLQ